MEHMLTRVSLFRDKYLTWIDLPVITFVDIIEIIIIAFLFYTILVWI